MGEDIHYIVDRMDRKVLQMNGNNAYISSMTSVVNSYISSKKKKPNYTDLDNNDSLDLLDGSNEKDLSEKDNMLNTLNLDSNEDLYDDNNKDKDNKDYNTSLDELLIRRISTIDHLRAVISGRLPLFNIMIIQPEMIASLATTVSTATNTNNVNNNPNNVNNTITTDSNNDSDNNNLDSNIFRDNDEDSDANIEEKQSVKNKSLTPSPVFSPNPNISNNNSKDTNRLSKNSVENVNGTNGGTSINNNSTTDNKNKEKVQNIFDKHYNIKYKIKVCNWYRVGYALGKIMDINDSLLFVKLLGVVGSVDKLNPTRLISTQMCNFIDSLPEIASQYYPEFDSSLFESPVSNTSNELNNNVNVNNNGISVDNNISVDKTNTVEQKQNNESNDFIQNQSSIDSKIKDKININDSNIVIDDNNNNENFNLDNYSMGGSIDISKKNHNIALIKKNLLTRSKNNQLLKIRYDNNQLTFIPDYIQTFVSLSTLMLKVYNKILIGGISKDILTPNMSYFIKFDNKVQKFIKSVLKDLDKISQIGLQDEFLHSFNELFVYS